MTGDKQPKFWLGDKVKVIDPRSRYHELVELVHALDVDDNEVTVFLLYTEDGERWFVANQLEAQP